MSIQDQAFEAGRDTGKALLEPGVSVRSLIAQEMQRIIATSGQLTLRERVAELELAQKRGNLERLSTQQGAARVLLEKTHSSRETHPGRYSFIRGWVYGGAAALVLLSDAVFLTLILASVLGLPPFAAGQAGPIGPIGALITMDLNAILSFSEIYLAALGLVALAVGLKAWVDQYPIKASPPNESSFLQRLRTPSGFVTVLICLTFAGLAASRLVLDYGTIGDVKNYTPLEEVVARGVAMLIGLAAFAGGAFLLMASMDVFSGRAVLRRHEADAKDLDRRVQAALESVHAAEAAYTNALVEREIEPVEQQLASARYQVLAEFRRGFAEGLGSTIRSAQGEGGYRRIRELLFVAGATGRGHAQPLLPSGE